MGVKQVFVYTILFFLSLSLHAQQSYVTHTVQAGETMYSITKKYNITEAELIKYNPDVSDGVQAGSILVIPKNALKPAANKNTEDYIYHTVQAQETLYGLSRKYNCTVEEILALNPEIEDGLKLGAIIKIPRKKAVDDNFYDSSQYMFHVVEPKETVFSICRVAGITEAKFLDLNPHVREKGLQIGQTIRLPIAEVRAVEELSTDVPRKKEFGLYRIQAGDDLITIAGKYNTTVEVLIDLNPELEGGIEVGRYIIVPTKKEKPRAIGKADFVESMFWHLPKVGEYPKVHLAVLVPLYLDLNDSIEMASYEENPKVYENSKIGLQFLAGLEVAMDTLVGLGYKITLDVYDTKNDLQTIRNIAKKIDRSVDLIIGPLYARNAEFLAKLLPSKTIVSPLSRALENHESINLVNCVPNLNSEYKEMASWINSLNGKSRVLFLNTHTQANIDAVASIKNYMYAADSLGYEEIWVDESFSQLKNLSSYLNLNTHNVLVVVDQDAALISDLLTKVNNRRDSVILILTTSKMFDIQTLESRYLNNQSFIGLNSELINYEDTCTQMFVQKFRRKAATEPNKFGLNGFDTGLYFAQLIGAYGVLPEVKSWPKSRGIYKGFFFQQHGSEGAQNNFVYKLRIRDFELKEVKQ